MTAGRALLVVVALVACGDDKKAAPKVDECQVYLDKARPVITEMTAKAGMSFGQAEQATFVRECRASKHKEPLFRCVVDAADEAAVRACYVATPSK